MTKALNILNKVTWGIAVVYLLNLFIPDYIHTFYSVNNSGDIIYNYGDQDYRLKFIILVLYFIPVVIFTFLKHSYTSKILIFVLSLILLFAYNKYTFIHDLINEYGFTYGQDNYAGYYPNVGLYITCSCLLSMFMLSVVRLILPVAKNRLSNQELIDDL